MTRIVPADKIEGQRLGQLIVNSLYRDMSTHQGVNTAELHDKLFYIENDKLEKLIQNFLQEKNK
jgi:hypothetical protein